MSLQRGRYFLRSASALAILLSAMGCSPSMNGGDLDTAEQSLNVQSPQPAFADAGSGDASQTTTDTSGNRRQTAQSGEVAGSEDATQSADEKPADADAQQAAALDQSKPADISKQQSAADAKKLDTTNQEATETAAGETTTAAEATSEAAAPAPKQQRGLLSSLFGSGKPKAASPQFSSEPGPGDIPVRVAARTPAPQKPAVEATATPPPATSQQALTNPSPGLTFESLDNRAAPTTRASRRNQTPEIRAVRASAFADDGEGSGLPGVRQSALFEIKRKSGVDDDSDVDLHEGSEGTQVALAPGMARMSPNGLLKQRDSVDVACLKPSLIRQIRILEAKFGKKAIITSGYRSPNYNRSVRGAKNSQHMYCAAVDMQIPGVSKWQLANYARTMQGRGGVGTYCHTDSVHIDVGPERDWNWRCRGRRS